MSTTTRKTVSSLYRRSLKLALDWAVHRNVWRGQAVYLRSLFDANKHIREPRQQKILYDETEKLLEKWKHPDPYRPPTAPGGSKYQRNTPVPILDEPPYEGGVGWQQEQQRKRQAEDDAQYAGQEQAPGTEAKAGH